MGAVIGGRVVVDLLKAEGVRYIFGIVGGTFLDVLDALYHDRSVEYVNVRHEQAGAFMADGLARVSGRPGHRSTETVPNDETYAYRCLPAGRNPGGGHQRPAAAR